MNKGGKKMIFEHMDRIVFAGDSVTDMESAQPVGCLLYTSRIADKIATIEESGTKILTLDDQTREEIREASKSVYASIKENIDPAIYNAYMDGIE